MPEELADQTTGEHSLHLPLPRLVETSFRGSASEVRALTDDELALACGTRIAFTQRHGGVSTGPYASLNLGDHVHDSPEAVERNRRIVVDALGGSAADTPLIVPKQVHGTRIIEVDDVERAQREAREGADGIVCRKAGVAVMLCFADCVPVTIVAPDGSFVVAHAGWRGAIAGIAEQAAVELAARSGFAARDLNAYIGPHVGACCYEVGADLLGRFAAEFGEGCRVDGKLDLSFAVFASLQRGGIVPSRIADARVCTACSVQDYYSYRAEDGVCGRHGAFARKER